MSEAVHQETYAEKMDFVHKQTRQAMDKVRPFVRCHCQRKLAMHNSFKCLYCGEWYCQTCAEEHFGQTRAEYLAQQPRVKI